MKSEVYVSRSWVELAIQQKMWLKYWPCSFDFVLVVHRFQFHKLSSLTWWQHVWSTMPRRRKQNTTVSKTTNRKNQRHYACRCISYLCTVLIFAIVVTGDNRLFFLQPWLSFGNIRKVLMSLERIIKVTLPCSCLVLKQHNIFLISCLPLCFPPSQNLLTCTPNNASQWENTFSVPKVPNFWQSLNTSLW